MSVCLERSSRANMHYKSCAVWSDGAGERPNAEIVRFIEGGKVATSSVTVFVVNLTGQVEKKLGRI
jgi:hypothetical protein